MGISVPNLKVLLAALLRRITQRTGLSKIAIAEKVGRSRGAIQQISRPGIDLIRQLEALAELSPDERHELEWAWLYDRMKRNAYGRRAIRLYHEMAKRKTIDEVRKWERLLIEEYLADPES